MADPQRRTELAVDEQLWRTPERFEFFQAVRLLLQLQLPDDQSDLPVRQAVGVGEEGHQGLLQIQFGASPSLSFPASDVVGYADAERGKNRGKTWPRLLVAFLGLTGPAGVLPTHYTKLIMRRGQARYADHTLRDFLDIFNHRAVLLFFQAWTKHFPPSLYEQFRLSDSKREDLFTFCLRCLVGLGAEGLRDRLDVDDEAIFYYSGHYAHFPRAAISLEELLGDYFGALVQVIQFQGRWFNLETLDRSRLPRRGAIQGQNCAVGRDLVLGTRVWDVQSKFRIRVGPLDYATFRGFLPGSLGLRRMHDLVRLYVGQQLDFETQLVLKRDEVPPAKLVMDRAAARRLGWDCWLKVREFTRDTDRAIFRDRHK